MVDAYDFIVNQRKKEIDDKDISEKLGLAGLSFGLSGNKSYVSKEELELIRREKYNFPSNYLHPPFLVEFSNAYVIGGAIKFNGIIESRRTSGLFRPDMAYLFVGDLIDENGLLFYHQGEIYRDSDLSLKQVLTDFSRARNMNKNKDKELQMLAIRTGFTLRTNPLKREVEEMPDIACYSVVHPGKSFGFEWPYLNFHKIEIKENDHYEPERKESALSLELYRNIPKENTDKRQKVYETSDNPPRKNSQVLEL